MRSSWIGFATLIVGVCVGAPLAFGQSFDCDKASTAVERLICEVPRLSDLDSALELAVRAKLTEDPTQRDALLANERAWVLERDKQCPNDKNHRTTAQITCLTGAYETRLVALRVRGGYTPLLTRIESQRTDICRRMGEKYRAFLTNRSSNHENGRFFPGSVLNNLSKTNPVGVTIAQTMDVDAANITEWSKVQTPPFHLSKELEGNITSSNWHLFFDHLPFTNYYSANSIGGTWHCYQEGVYFQVEGGEARSSPAPRGWTDQSCLTQRLFGAIDGSPVAIEEEQNRDPFGETSLTITSWEGDHFSPACTVKFRFKPSFDFMTAESPYEPDQCEGKHCDELKRATLELIKRVRATTGPIGAWRDSQIARLTPQQRMVFDALARGSDDSLENPSASSGIDFPADTATVRFPLLLPLVSGEVAYLAKVGHVTWGDGIPDSDWNVKIERWDGVSSQDQASLTILVRDAELENVSVQ